MNINAPKEIPFIDNIEKFLSKIRIDPISECWNWVGGLNKGTGYGYFRGGKKPLRVHRVSYSIFKGDLDLSKVIDHVCKNRACVNPDHLRELTSQQNSTINSNSSAGINFRSTHCKYGHEFIGNNLIINKKTGKRNCRTCQRAHHHINEKKLPLSDLPKFFHYEKKETVFCVNGHNVKDAPRRSKGSGFYCKQCSELYKLRRIEKAKMAIE